MFDFNKSSITGISISELLKNNLLTFSFPVNPETGEILQNRKVASFHDFDFTITNDLFIDLQGSFHKYHNLGKHNYSDFSTKDFFSVLNDLTERLKINPFLATLHNLEFGVNIELPFSTREFLNAIISFKGKEYEKRVFNGAGYLLRFKFHHYELKIYDKGLQYRLNKNLLRFEIKVKKMEFFRARNIHIHSFADLLNTTETKKLIPILLTAFNELLIYDNTIQPKQLKKRERELLLNGRNPKYWSELKQQSKETFKHKRQRFRELVLIHGKKNIQQTVYELIKTKLLELLNTDRETEQKFSQYLNSFSIKSCPEITVPTCPKITDLTIDHRETNLPRNNTSNSMSIRDTSLTEGRRYCQTCGRDITEQKKGSVFCSEKIFGKDAKKCRNKESNPRNNYRHKEVRMYGGGFLLFDINQLKQQPTAN